MSHNLENKVQGIQKLLESWGLTCEVVEFPQGTRTSADAAACIGCDLSQIAKSLIFRTAHTSKPVLILASGSNRVNEQAIAYHLGETITKADADFTKQKTGFAVGGIPPFGHNHPIELTFIDQDLLQHQTVWTAAGTPRSVFNIPTNDLIQRTQAKIISLRDGE